MSSTSKIDVAKLKASGILPQKDPNLVTVRLRVIGGRVDVDHLDAIRKIAASYGCDHIHLTTRQGVEIPNVGIENIDNMRAAFADAGMSFAGGGPSVRTITACPGAACVNGLIDPQSLAQKISDRFGDVSGLPHKFKIGVAGCPNCCIKPRENDLGIMGIAYKSLDSDSCTLCGKCLRTCKVPDALAIEDKRLILNEDTCVLCGGCVSACSFDAWKHEGSAYAIFVGGRMGRHPRLANRLPHPVDSEEQVLAVIDQAIRWYAENGNTKERFGAAIDRVGADSLVRYLADM